MKAFSQRFYHAVFWPLRIVFAIKHPVLRVHGRENIPEGAAIVCCNHSAFSDPIWVVFGAHPKRIFRTMAKKELFGHKVLSWLITKVGAFPVDRSTSDINAVKTAMQILKSGDKLLIFPEGTRIRKGKTAEPHGGAVMIAARMGVPIVPVYLSTDKRIFRPLDVVFGEPYHPHPSDRRVSNEEMDALTQGMMQRIYALGKTL